MKMILLTFTGAAWFVAQSLLVAEPAVLSERSDSPSPFTFKSLPAPSKNDAAAGVAFSLVDGQRDTNGGDLDALHDGRVALQEDEPGASFFFRAGTSGGRIQVDLGRVLPVKQVNTYSWHNGPRAPQVYRLFAADGEAAGFDPAPKKQVDPSTCGWKRVAAVDTRPQESDMGGQFGVSIADQTNGQLGRFRYLLFDVERTEDRDPFGNTFFTEIDVIDADGPAAVPIVTSPAKPIQAAFDSRGGRYHFVIDATAAPDLLPWAEEELIPVVQEWYPRIVGLLPSDGFVPRTNLTLRFRNDMGGTPASAGGGSINMNSGWFRKELQREARGSVVHEMVHVVQSYGNARRNNPNATRTPGWLVEGLADYVRWFIYEPESRGALITARNIGRAKFDASYRVTANFLNWVSVNYDRQLARKLNAAARNGQYSPQLWKDLTGKTVEELGEEWLGINQERLKGEEKR